MTLSHDNQEPQPLQLHRAHFVSGASQTDCQLTGKAQDFNLMVLANDWQGALNYLVGEQTIKVEQHLFLFAFEHEANLLIEGTQRKLSPGEALWLQGQGTLAISSSGLICAEMQRI